MVACIEIVLRRDVCNLHIPPCAGLRSMIAGASGDPCHGAVALMRDAIMSDWRAGSHFSPYVAGTVKREMY